MASDHAVSVPQESPSLLSGLPARPHQPCVLPAFTLKAGLLALPSCGDWALRAALLVADPRGCREGHCACDPCALACSVLPCHTSLSGPAVPVEFFRWRIPAWTHPFPVSVMRATAWLRMLPSSCMTVVIFSIFTSCGTKLRSDSARLSAGPGSQSGQQDRERASHSPSRGPLLPRAPSPECARVSALPQERSRKPLRCVFPHPHVLSAGSLLLNACGRLRLLGERLCGRSGASRPRELSPRHAGGPRRYLLCHVAQVQKAGHITRGAE